jgi:hypothetical protein
MGSPMKPTRPVSAKEMQNIANVMNEVQTFRSELDLLRSELAEVRKTMAHLISDNAKLHELVASLSAVRNGQDAPLENNDSNAAQRRSESVMAKGLVDSTDEPVNTLYPKEQSTEATVRERNASPENVVPAKKKSKKAARIEPHAAADLVKHQRKDAVLRQFMQTQMGLYTIKSMSLHEIDGCQIFFFDKKAYIPAKLRAKTIRHYKQTNVDANDALAALKSNCIWPTLEEDFTNDGLQVETSTHSTSHAGAGAAMATTEMDSALVSEQSQAKHAPRSTQKAVNRRVAL